MDIKPCPLCGCGSGNDEGDCFPIAEEVVLPGFWPLLNIWKVECKNPECMAAASGFCSSEAIDRWDNGDVV